MIIGEPDFVSLHRENGFEFKLDISKVCFHRIINGKK